jgi:opacity protein-like surface antigen
MKKLTGLVAMLAVISIAADADAGILGKRYIGASVGQVTPGNDEVKDIDDSIISYGVGLRLPINANLDFVGSIGQSKLDGDTTMYDPMLGFYDVDIEGTGTSLGALLQYQFKPGEQVNPFVDVGVLWGKSEIEASVAGYTESEDDDDTGVTVGAGVEFNIDEKISINTGISYQSEMFDEDDVIAGVGFNAWVTPQLLLSVVGQYAFDSEDKGISAGIAVGF